MVLTVGGVDGTISYSRNLWIFSYGWYCKYWQMIRRVIEVDCYKQRHLKNWRGTYVVGGERYFCIRAGLSRRESFDIVTGRELCCYNKTPDGPKFKNKYGVGLMEPEIRSANSLNEL